MSILEFLRADHRHEQIDEEQQGNDANDNCLHKIPLEFVAKAHVKSAHDKKHDHTADEE
jgi:hypothetical protein